MGNDAVVMLGNGLTVTVALPDEVPAPQPPASVIAVIVYVVVANGLTVRVAGVVETVWVKFVPPAPSSHVTFHGDVPLRSAWMVAVLLLQIVVLSALRTTAAGRQSTATKAFSWMSSNISVTPGAGAKM